MAARLDFSRASKLAMPSARAGLRPSSNTFCTNCAANEGSVRGFGGQLVEGGRVGRAPGVGDLARFLALFLVFDRRHAVFQEAALVERRHGAEQRHLAFHRFEFQHGDLARLGLLRQVIVDGQVGAVAERGKFADGQHAGQHPRLHRRHRFGRDAVFLQQRRQTRRQGLAAVRRHFAARRLHAVFQHGADGACADRRRDRSPAPARRRRSSACVTVGSSG